MDTIFTIRTEYTPQYQRNAEAIVGGYFESFNIQRGTGYWKGQREESMTIEIISQSSQRSAVRRAAEGIREVNKQEAVFLTQQDINAELL